jgi:hypothetical protein
MAIAKRPDEVVLRQWARDRMAVLADAMNGRRHAKVRDVLASYVERIVITPSTKRGIMAVNAAAYHTCRYKQNDRPEGQSWVNMVAGAGFEPSNFGL